MPNLRRKPRNLKYPCIHCKTKSVTKTQKALECDACKKWVHLKCTDLSDDQYIELGDNEDLLFFCLICKPRTLYADLIFDTHQSLNNHTLSSSDSEAEFSSAHDSDFEYVDDSDSDSRGLDFDSLPIRNTNVPNFS